MRDYVSELIHSFIPGSVLLTKTPGGISEAELLALAASDNFDVAIVVVNNVSFPPHEIFRRPATLASDQLTLVAKLKQFGRPIIALSGWPNDPSHISALGDAGATFASRLPFNDNALKPVLQRCLLGQQT